MDRETERVARYGSEVSQKFKGHEPLLSVNGIRSKVLVSVVQSYRHPDRLTYSNNMTQQHYEDGGQFSLL